MSDGGVDIDELIKRRLNSDNFFGTVTDPKTGLRVSYPYIPRKGPLINKDDDDSIKSSPIKEKKSAEKLNLKEILEPLSSRRMNLKSRKKQYISFKSSIFKNRSFSALFKEGWTKEELMEYFALSEIEYIKIIESLKKISITSKTNH